MEQNYYITGRDVRKKHWRVLKIDRNNPSELVTLEDPTTYSCEACTSLLCSIDEESKPTGGLKVVTDCYGIVGMFKLVTEQISYIMFAFTTNHLSVPYIDPLILVCLVFRFHQIIGNLLHPSHNRKKGDWKDLRSSNIFHL